MEISKELFDALLVIKGECERNRCSTCPLGVGDGCFVRLEPPEDYNLYEKTTYKIT